MAGSLTGLTKSDTWVFALCEQTNLNVPLIKPNGPFFHAANSVFAKVGRLASEEVKVKVHTLDIAPLRSESPLQKRSGMARVLKGLHSFTCTATRSSAIRMSHTCLCLPSRSWYSFTDPGGMEG